MRRQRKSPRSGFLSGVITGLLLSLTAMAAWYYSPNLAGAPQSGSPLSSYERTPPIASEPVNVLVLGVDERNGDTGRSDSMFLVHLAGGEARVLSIPRDTLVSIPGYGEGKANSAYTYGGPELAKEVVGGLLNMPVHHYVKVNLAGFRHVVDLMGGVSFDVPKRMYYVDPYDQLVIDLKPGRQILDGEKAEQFVRFRHDEIGDDVGRIHRQQEFLKAAAAQALTPSNLPRLPGLLSTARQYVQTDLPVTAQLSMAHDLYRAQQRGALVQETLPGHGDYVDGISFFLVDQQALTQLMAIWTGPKSHS